MRARKHESNLKQEASSLLDIQPPKLGKQQGNRVAPGDPVVAYAAHKPSEPGSLLLRAPESNNGTRRLALRIKNVRFWYFVFKLVWIVMFVQVLRGDTDSLTTGAAELPLIC